MPDINETIVRHFFELNGFLVRTNVKYKLTKVKGSGDSDIDLVVYNLDPDKHHPPHDFVLNKKSLPGIERAIVEVKGWHNDAFTRGTISSFPEVFNFVRPEAIEAASEFFRGTDFRRILVLSKLSLVEESRNAAMEILKAGGIEHVIEFATIIHCVAKRVETNKNYPDSEIMQTMRLVKIYGMGREGDGTE